MFVFCELLLISVTVDAASFDCAKAASAIEKLICSNDELSKLDEKLSKTYQLAINQAPDKARVITEQKQWLNNVRSSCQDANCLKSAYQTRIIALTPDLPADRINAAIPIPKTAQLAWATLIGTAVNSGERRELEYAFKAQMKIRGLGCALVYEPTKATSNEEIVKQLAGNPCIDKADASLTDWLGKRRVAQMLRLPPLRPLPKSVPGAVERNLDIQGVRFAADAGVAALWNYQFLEVFDLQNNRSILKEEGLSVTAPGEFSPNGRLLIVSQPRTAAIMDAETGEILTRIFARPDEVYWLDRRVAMFVDASNRGMMLVDFRTGNQKKINFMQDTIFRVAALPQHPGEYLMFSLKSAMRVKVDSSGVDPQVTLVAEKPFKIQNAFRGRGTLCSGGKYFINASRNVAVTSTETLDTEVVPLDTFDIQTVMPLPDPDTVLLTGILTSNRSFNSGLDHFIYSISNHTLSHADHDEYSATRFIYLPSIKTIGQIDHNTISFIKNIHVQSPIMASEFNVQPKVELPGGNGEIPPAPRVLSVAPAAPSNGIPRYALIIKRDEGISTRNGTEPDTPPIEGPIFDIAKNSDVEGIGIYRAAGSDAGMGRQKAGTVNVDVRRSEKPILLILSSYNSVNWKISMQPGARVSAILLSGYVGSTVEGGGSARIVSIGSASGYQVGSPQYKELEREIYGWTGKKPSLFQVGYEGTQFEVGGNFSEFRSP